MTIERGKDSKGRCGLASSFCRWCDYPWSYECKGSCPAFKKYRRKWGKKRYRYFLKRRLRGELDENT